MKLSYRASNYSGMTLIEMAIVILIIISLVTILLIGAKAWKSSADRVGCIMNIRNFQQALRSYQYMNDVQPEPTEYQRGGQFPRNKIVGTGSFFEKEPKCPAGGIYNIPPIDGVIVTPRIGEVYLQCSLAFNERHFIDNSRGW